MTLQVCPNLDILVPALVEGGIDELEKRCALTPGKFCSVDFISITIMISPTISQIQRSFGDCQVSVLTFWQQHDSVTCRAAQVFL